MFRKILVPTDGSELSGNAVAAAIKLAEENGASLLALTIQPIYRPPMVAEVAARAKTAGVPCTTRVQFDASTWEAIIREAREEGCDLIFMASHGRRGMAGLLLGSETQKVLTHCKIPVLVYR